MIYPSKILLFGEYTILFGSQGLAIPFDHFYGKWIKDDSAQHFKEACDLFNQEIYSGIIDLKKLNSDVDNGYYFSSSVPEGHGLGSSGALVAAIYEHYKIKEEQSLVEIKKNLSQLENIYHGESSGIDPLVSLIKKPILIKNAHEAQTLSLPQNTWSQLGNFFLIDSLLSRQSINLVTQFKKSMQLNPSLKNELLELAPLINNAIKAYQLVNKGDLDSLMYDISRLQFKIFQDLIPESIKPIWEQGLLSRDYVLKLCGAGGGGYFIGYQISAKETHFPGLPILRF